MFGPDGQGRLRSWGAETQRGATGGVAPGGVQRGTDTFINPDIVDSRSEGRAVVVPLDGDLVEISLVNASVEAAAKAILGDTLGQNYVISGRIDGTVTIQTTGPVPKAVLLELFEASLAAIGAQLERSGSVVQVVPGVSGNTTFRVAGRNGRPGASVLVAPLKYISAVEMTKLLQPLADQGLNVVSDRQRNLLLLSGPAQAQEAALDALNLFDVDVLRGKSVALVRLHSAEPEAIVGELTKIFESEEGGLLNGVVEFIPNPRLSSVLVISSRAEYIDRAQRWIRQLDTTATGASVYMATYELSNRSASEIAPILNEMLRGQSTASEDGGPAEGSGIAVAADDSRNSLVVRGRQGDHEQVRAILRSLDSTPRQVLLEATIAEVTLNDEIDIGTRWFFERGNWDFRFSDLASGAVVGNSPSFTAVFGAGSAEVALSALASVTEVRVISSPTLMVLNNKEGVLQIGDEVPIATQTATDADDDRDLVLTQVEYRDTGIILRVQPRIGSGGQVVLDISQEVSDVAQTRTSGIDSPTIRQRRVQTSVILGDGQTLALGGLVQEADNVSRTEVPGLGRVPVVGNLFRSKGSRKDRTELLILIRPRVILTGEEAASTTGYWRRKLAATDTVLQTGLGKPTHTVRDYTR